MTELLALPILTPLGSAAACLLAWRSRRLQRLIAVAGALVYLAAGLWLFASVARGGILVTYAGNWPPPYGIPLVADLFSAALLVLIGIAGAAVTIYATAAIDPRREAFGYHPLFQMLLMGLAGGLLTGDIFNLYVWFEVSLISSFVLLVLGGEKDQIVGGLKYVALNLLSSALFLSGVGLLYGLTGTLNMADLAVKLRASEPAPLLIIGMFFLAAFGIKAALFPFFFWLPASYPTPPAVVAAFFAGSLTELGVYALIRVFSLVFAGPLEQTKTIVLTLAALTMLAGVIGAIAQTRVRRILSFQLVSHVGYTMMGLALFTPLALAGAIFFALQEVIVKTNLFLLSGLITALQGTGKLASMGGLYRSHPILAAMFFISALALSGVPPLSGFFPKAALVKAALDDGRYWISGVALATSLLTLYSMMKIWGAAFWRPRAEGPEKGGDGRLAQPAARRSGIRLWAPPAILTGIILAMGAGAGPMLRLASEAAEQLLRTDGYIQAVLGTR